jgi:hypothetical protein
MKQQKVGAQYFSYDLLVAECTKLFGEGNFTVEVSQLL